MKLTPEQFCFWMQGAIDIYRGGRLEQHNWERIKAMLELTLDGTAKESKPTFSYSGFIRNAIDDQSNMPSLCPCDACKNPK